MVSGTMFVRSRGRIVSGAMKAEQSYTSLRCHAMNWCADNRQNPFLPARAKSTMPVERPPIG